MIIIKIIFLYFIEIAHTDDFPLNGYPASDSTIHFKVKVGKVEKGYVRSK